MSKESWRRRLIRKRVFSWGRDGEVVACSVFGVAVKEGGGSWAGSEQRVGICLLRASRLQERGPRGEAPGSLHIGRREPEKSLHLE